MNLRDCLFAATGALLALLLVSLVNLHSLARASRKLRQGDRRNL